MRELSFRGMVSWQSVAEEGGVSKQVQRGVAQHMDNQQRQQAPGEELSVVSFSGRVPSHMLMHRFAHRIVRFSAALCKCSIEF